MKYLLSLFACFGVCAIYSQTNYYVGPNGNDNNAGTFAQPWKTFQYACDGRSPGDVINALAGTYNEKFEIYSSGTSLNPIIIKAHQNDIVTITGSGITTQDAIIGIYDQDYIHIENLIIADNQMIDAIGIIVEGGNDGIEIRNCEFKEINFSNNPNDNATSNTNAQPLIVYGIYGNDPITDLIIEGNRIYNNRPGYSEALAVNGNVDGFEVFNNEVFDNQNIGIDIIGHEGTAPANDQARNGIVYDNIVYNNKSPYALSAGIYVDGGKDITIERNTVYDNQWGIEIGCENLGTTTSGIIVRNNMVFENDDSGLSIGGYDYPNVSGKVVDCLVRNNTFYGNDKNSGGLGNTATEIFLSYTENCQIINNIFSIDNAFDLMMYEDNTNSQNLVLDYNLYYSTTGTDDYEFTYEGINYYGLAAFQAGTSQEAHGISADPLFENISNVDFHLMSNSPCIDASDPATSTDPNETDFEGENRNSNGIDIGADEFQQAVNNQLEHEILNSEINIYPNPANNQFYYVSGNLSLADINILDVNGTVVQNLNGLSSPIEIDISTLGVGIYFLKIQHLNHSTLHMQRLIKY